MKSNPAVPGGSLVSKPTWSNTSGFFATSAFLWFRFSVSRRDVVSVAVRVGLTACQCRRKRSVL